MWNDLKRSLEDVWLAVGEGVTIVASKISVKLVPVLDDALDRVSDWSKWAMSDRGGKVINKWIDKAGEFFIDLWKVLKKVHQFTMENVIPSLKSLKGYIIDIVRWWQGLSDTERSMLKWGAAISIIAVKFSGFFSLLGKVPSVVGALSPLISSFGLLAGKIGLVVGALAAAFKGGMELGKVIDEFLGRADKYRVIKEGLRISTKQKEAAEQESRFKDIKQRMIALENLPLGGSSGAIDQLRRMMQEGILTAEGRINIRHPDIGTARKAAGLEAILKRSLTKMAQLEMGEGREVTGAQILQQAIPTATPQKALESIPTVGRVPEAIKPPPTTLAPVAEPPRPKIQVTASSPTEEKLLAEIRDGIFRLINQKRHPSRQVVESLL
jgi:hypothetical protein